MTLQPFSPRQMQVLCWWCTGSRFADKQAVICDGAVRSGKTLCMGISFVCWAFYRFNGRNFALCGKTVRGIRRNLVVEMLPVLQELGFSCQLKLADNVLEIRQKDKFNRFYLFGGKDEGSQSLIQGLTLAGVLFDEVALMPRSFVQQAMARCSVEGAKFWFNCNPDSPQHWFYREWILQKDEKNALYLHFTMRDNPSLSAETRTRYENLFAGTFYERFVLGKWVAAQGLIYPFMEGKTCDDPGICTRYMLSCDYGTMNPCAVGLWGEQDGVWYRLDEYYYDGRQSGTPRTDAEHLQGILRLLDGRKPSALVIDPSAASFIALLKKQNLCPVLPAKNAVLDGIRQVSSALKEGRIRICACCRDTMREFGLYRWQDDLSRDAPVKENDHAMDDIRYFVSTVLCAQTNESFAYAVDRTEAECSEQQEGEEFWDF